MADFFPQFFYVAVDGPVANVSFIGKDLVHELLAPIKASGMSSQKVQQLEFNVRQEEVKSALDS